MSRLRAAASKMALLKYTVLASSQNWKNTVLRAYGKIADFLWKLLTNKGRGM